MLQIQNLSKAYGKKQILDQINLDIKPGEITGLVGVNGTGKSTLINCIAGLLNYKGQILIDQVPLKRPNLQIAHVSDHLNLPPQMRVKEAKDFMTQFYPQWNPRRAEDIQAFFNLDDQQEIKNLSKGNQAKLNLMLGLALDTPYLLLDEPFAGIDIFSREQTLELFSNFIQQDCGVLVTTHELYDVEFFIDRAVLLKEGQVVRSAYLEDVRENEQLSLVEWMRKELV
ncbi:ABC transporter ATP-binding protein [Facklamia languida]